MKKKLVFLEIYQTAQRKLHGESVFHIDSPLQTALSYPIIPWENSPIFHPMSRKFKKEAENFALWKPIILNHADLGS